MQSPGKQNRGSRAKRGPLVALALAACVLGSTSFLARDAQASGPVYRYIDARLGSLNNRLDEDDVLIVMSDHGIRTSMEHAPLAFFVADGDGIANGRSLGAPELAGVSRSLVELFGISTDWPDTGVAPWTQSARASLH